MSITKNVQKVGQRVALALGVTAATAGVAEAATQIYAFTKDACYRTTIQLNRGEGYWFPVGDVNIRGTIDSATGRRSWEDAFNVVGNVTAAFYTEGRQHGIVGSYASMKGCTGSWAEYCGTVTAVHKDGKLPSFWSTAVEKNLCLSKPSTRSMFEAIVNGETRRVVTPAPVQPVVTTKQPPVPAPVEEKVVVVKPNSRVEQNCRVDNQGCVHVELKFDF